MQLDESNTNLGSIDREKMEPTEQFVALDLAKPATPIPHGKIKSRTDTTTDKNLILQKSQKTGSTIAQYEKRAANILKIIENEFVEEEISPALIARWLTIHAKTISNSTLRQYRSALTYKIGELMNNGRFREDEGNSAIRAMASVRAQPQPVGTASKTSALKAKSISEKKVRALEKKLAGSSLKWGQLAAQVFVATLVTGMRPVEWQTATASPPEGEPDFDNGVVLAVTNAKATNGRAHGETRELFVPPGEQTDVVITALLAVKKSVIESGGRWEIVYDGIRRAILAANIKNDSGQFVSLYTARHQFSANAKNIYTKEEVAYLMGHSSSETASNHYGKKRSGHQRFKIAGKLNQSMTDSADQASFQPEGSKT